MLSMVPQKLVRQYLDLKLDLLTLGPVFAYFSRCQRGKFNTFIYQELFYLERPRILRRGLIHQ
ncbi:hypothetical protein AAW02_08170 [Aeromonas dhakensis]|nr:hypothetical protein AAW02_08170 [Aeromonas dhakensis]PHS89836.1 hypothetical protein AAW03_02185 [Aeromonas dhakensis]TNI20288.1 hypothetical protein CF132_11955 [Aeromonas dhakensis]